jgi:hypothetical protein
VLSAQIMILWSWTLLTWWWLRWLPLHFPPDLSNKSSVVITRICVMVSCLYAWFHTWWSITGMPIISFRVNIRL